LSRSGHPRAWQAWLDGRPIDLTAFGTLPDHKFYEPEVGAVIWLRQWNVVLVNPKQGKHTIRYVERTCPALKPKKSNTWTFTVTS
jgi:hypothetical protein